MITIALPKGRLAEKTLEMLKKCDIIISENTERKLKVLDKSEQLCFLFVKPSDVPTYVDHGIADIGIAGKDTLLEANLPLYEMLDLKIGACTMCVCGFEEQNNQNSATLRIATKYPNIAKDYYLKKGVPVEIIKLNGSIELAPLLGLSDVIVDIVESGRTLRENGLCVLEKICDISARICINRVSFKTKNKEITKFLKNMEEANASL